MRKGVNEMRREASEFFIGEDRKRKQGVEEGPLTGAKFTNDFDFIRILILKFLGKEN